MPLHEHEFQFLRDLIYRKASFVLERSKEATIEMRLRGLLAEAGLSSIGALVRKLREGAIDLEQRFVDCMTNHETLFFRDPYFFDALRTDVIPELMAARSTRRRLRIWSSACSSGQEAYSVAILLHEHFPALRTWDVRITASDVSRELVERTRKGEFSSMEVRRGLAPDLRARYFDNHGDGVVAKRRLRNMIDTRQLNLAEAWPRFETFDLILLRNVLIYFDIPTKKKVLGRVRRSLAKDGFLVLGGGESTFKIDASWNKAQRGRAVLYRPEADGPPSNKAVGA